MGTAEKTSQERQGDNARERPAIASSPYANGKPLRIEPDLDFIHVLRRRSRDSYKKCFQCGTCSATCTISPETNPFPAKEMAWAVWGMKDVLVRDPDIWLCYQCSDCSMRCPRGAKPGDILAGIRQEAIRHFAAPRFLGRWVNQPKYIPLLLGIPAVLLGLVLILTEPIQNALGMSGLSDGRIVYSYSSAFPHWALNSFFLIFSVFALIAAVTGVRRFWRAMKSGVYPHGAKPSHGTKPQDAAVTREETVALGETAVPVKGILPSIGSVLKSVLAHDNFSTCTAARSRYVSHVGMFFGFLALSLVTIWVITSGFNPLTGRDFVYPFNFWSPWKILANLGGAGILFGCALIIRDRLVDDKDIGHGSYADWALVLTLFLVVVTGFATELLHYMRLEPHRHVIYFLHLVFAFALLMYLPYSKFGHIIYRGTAMVFAEHIGRKRESPPAKTTD